MPSPVASSLSTRLEETGCRAIAHSNIALAKYWGKRDRERNIPDVPSLSLTLGGLSTTTHVRFGHDLDADQFILDGKPADGASAAKVFRLIDRVRRAGGIHARCRVESTNDFPTASGLASSASGFAALAVATLGAAGLSWPRHAVSELARASSVSAARSIFGGFVKLPGGGEAAQTVQTPDGMKRVRMLIAVTETGPKAVGSTEGMLRTQDTSPYYSAWREAAPFVYRELEDALLGGNLEKLGEAMEHSTLLMHASMFGAKPALVYWNSATLAAMQAVRELRARGILAYYTMDAGPHVKVLTTEDDVEQVRAQIEALPSVKRVIVSQAGDGARVVGER